MKIYTIGFTKKSAENFFSVLEEQHIEALVDIRLNNTSQLAGFSRYPDLPYFLEKIIHVRYIQDPDFAPSKEMLRRFREGDINWDAYTLAYQKLLEERNIKDHIQEKYRDFLDKNICLLCSEDKADHCHRSLAAQEIKKQLGGEIINL
ncbi:MAG: DUF488 domain-containing protein [Fusobacteriaceae bacterium]|jgi:uncharacterized protein (DUF488 family)|nr:DUF488 domain-containing protein [Fusobacteriaceae bacterium]